MAQTTAPPAQPSSMPMRLFNYTAVSVDGEVMKGVMEATRPDAVWNALTARGFRPTEVKAQRKSPLGDFFNSLTKVKAQEVIIFCEQLATFVRVGIPITSALETIGEGTGN